MSLGEQQIGLRTAVVVTGFSLSAPLTFSTLHTGPLKLCTKQKRTTGIMHGTVLAVSIVLSITGGLYYIFLVGFQEGKKSQTKSEYSSIGGCLLHDLLLNNYSAPRFSTR